MESQFRTRNSNRVGVRIVERQKYRHPRTVRRRVNAALNANSSFVSLNKLLCYPKPDSRPNGATRGKEWLEDPFDMVGGNALPSVVHTQQQTVPVGLRCLLYRRRESAARRHRIDRIGDEVGDNLHHLSLPQHDLRTQVELRPDLNSRRGQLGLIDIKGLPDQPGKGNLDGGGVLPVVTQGLLCDMGYTNDL